jgi:glucose/arabinose dehydrogenase
MRPSPTLVALAAGSVLLAAPPAAFATGHTQPQAPEPASAPTALAPYKVIASSLNNPRQLHWTNDGKTLIVAEAGHGAPTREECTALPLPPDAPPDVDAPLDCVGPTGSITTIERPAKRRPRVKRVIEGLPSSDPWSLSR